MYAAPRLNVDDLYPQSNVNTSHGAQSHVTGTCLENHLARQTTSLGATHDVQQLRFVFPGSLNHFRPLQHLTLTSCTRGGATRERYGQPLLIREVHHRATFGHVDLFGSASGVRINDEFGHAEDVNHGARQMPEPNGPRRIAWPYTRLNLNASQTRCNTARLEVWDTRFGRENGHRGVRRIPAASGVAQRARRTA